MQPSSLTVGSHGSVLSPTVGEDGPEMTPPLFKARSEGPEVLLRSGREEQNERLEIGERGRVIVIQSVS